MWLPYDCFLSIEVALLSAVFISCFVVIYIYRRLKKRKTRSKERKYRPRRKGIAKYNRLNPVKEEHTEHPDISNKKVKTGPSLIEQVLKCFTLKTDNFNQYDDQWKSEAMRKKSKKSQKHKSKKSPQKHKSNEGSGISNPSFESKASNENLLGNAKEARFDDDTGDTFGHEATSSSTNSEEIVVDDKVAASNYTQNCLFSTQACQLEQRSTRKPEAKDHSSSNNGITTSKYRSTLGISLRRRNDIDVNSVSSALNDVDSASNTGSVSSVSKHSQSTSTSNRKLAYKQFQEEERKSEKLYPYAKHEKPDSILTRTQHLQSALDKLNENKNDRIEKIDELDCASEDSVNDSTKVVSTLKIKQNHIILSTAGVKIRMESVSDPISINEYAAQEWKGDTIKADKIRRGYDAVQQETGYTCIRRIRGDNYCALRAVLFKVLSCGIDITEKYCVDIHITELPFILQNKGCDWVTKWNFANRLPFINDSSMETLVNCLELLKDSVDRSCSCNVDSERYAIALDLMNQNEETEIRLFEALKFLMLYSSVQLFDSMGDEDSNSMLAMLLFARDTSQDPKCFMMNHLNHVGDSGGLDQLEMMLLGHSLDIVISVFRLHQVDEADFIARFPDDYEGTEKEEIFIVAEDDRHYNVLSEEM